MVRKPSVNTSYSSPNRGYAGVKHKPEAVVWHVTVGGAAGSLSWLTNPDSNASSNYLIAKDGTIYELVPPTESAWANGAINKPDMSNPVVARWVNGGINPNTRSVSIEVERLTSANGQPGGFTPAQYKALVTLTAWLCQEFRLTPDRVHIFGHRTIDSVNRANCPGLAESEWFALVGAVAALVNGAIPPPSVADPGFPGALQPDGTTRLNGVDFGGQAVTVEEVTTQVRNAAGQRYRRTWAGHALDEWQEVK